MSKPWDRPPLPANGDEDIRSTFEAVGRVLSAWENAENGAAHLFATLMGDLGASLKARHAFSAVVAAKTRAEMMGTVAKYFFGSWNEPQSLNDELRASLGTIKTQTMACIKGYGLLSGRRNDIAHGMVQQHWNGGFVLLPPHWSLGRRPAGELPVYGYDSAGMRRYVRIFSDLSEDLHQCAIAINNWNIGYRSFWKSRQPTTL